jgi:hypothetical protein
VQFSISSFRKSVCIIVSIFINWTRRTTRRRSFSSIHYVFFSWERVILYSRVRVLHSKSSNERTFLLIQEKTLIWDRIKRKEASDADEVSLLSRQTVWLNIFSFACGSKRRRFIWKQPLSPTQHLLILDFFFHFSLLSWKLQGK